MKVIEYTTNGSDVTLANFLALDGCVGGRTLPRGRVQVFFKQSSPLVNFIKAHGEWQECQVPATASQCAALGLDMSKLEEN